MSSEAGAGVLFPVLGVSPCKKQLLHLTLGLATGAMLWGHEVEWRARDISIGLTFC